MLVFWRAPPEESSMTTLDDPTVASLLARLHAAAKSDVRHFLRAAPAMAAGWVRGGSAGAFEALAPHLKDAFIPVSPDAGRFLYLTARAIGARHIVEYGTSFAISTLYLAAAVRDNGGGRVIGTELEPTKHARALAHLREAGLDDVAEVRLGDARETLAKDLPAPLDLVLLDGWKDLYAPILDHLTPHLRPGAVVLADNVRTFKKTLAPFVARLQSGRNGYASVTLPFSSGLEYAVRLGAGAPA
jgi:predicted O-methyltransferase YrrM